MDPLSTPSPDTPRQPAMREVSAQYLTPLPKEKSLGLGVLLFGLGTSAVTLAVVWILALYTEFRPMGFYVNFVIPLGAIGVGLVSGCGYGIGSWVTGTRVHRGLLWIVLALQVFTYFAFQYAEYWVFVRPQIPISFVDYFDVTTRTIVFKEEAKVGNPLGAWGYGVRALEILGFALGGLAAPAALLKKPYCDLCQVYKRSRELGLVPAGVVPRKIGKKDTAAQEAFQKELETNLQDAQKTVALLAASANQGDAESFVRLLTQVCGKRKDVMKLSTRLIVSLDRCPRCHTGSLVITAQSGFGEHITNIELARGELPPAMVHQIEDRLKAAANA